MANPRKFSEKIALHHQKQAEETAAFEKIMREVSDATNKPEEMTLAAQYGLAKNAAMSGAGSGGRPTQRGRATASSSVGPMRARPAERKHDTSPYSSNIYLSPPDSNNWRRTNSDSALHQSCALSGEGVCAGHSQHALHLAPHHLAAPHHAHRRVTDSNIDSCMLAMLEANQNRPRSSCEMPRVPGINVYPSQELCSPEGLGGGDMQVPGGSLPDLTSVHYASHDDHSSSPYSSSPVSASPATLSPTQLPPLRQPGARHYAPAGHAAVVNAGGGASPGPYSPTPSAQNHLSVPNTNRYLQCNKQPMTLEQSWIAAGYQQQCSPPSLHSSHSNINLPSPTMGVPPSQVCGGGRSPGARSPHSVATSPADSPQHPDTYYITQALQQHFEQFTMMDRPATSLDYMNHVTTNSPQFTQSSLRSPERDSGVRMGGDPVATGNGGLFHHPACGPACLGGPGCLATPATPTTIPDIILTDFSSGGCAAGELGKELGVSDASLFPDDEGLREGLNPIDFDGLQMLDDPDMNVISDPTMEDAFRLDRL